MLLDDVVSPTGLVAIAIILTGALMPMLVPMWSCWWDARREVRAVKEREN